MCSHDPLDAFFRLEYGRLREELRYQDTHIWGVGKFYITTTVAIGAALVAMLQYIKDVSPAPSWLLPAIYSILLIWFCYGLLLFQRILAHRWHFVVHKQAADIMCKIGFEKQGMYYSSRLANEMELRPWSLRSWHITLALLVVISNALLATVAWSVLDVQEIGGMVSTATVVSPPSEINIIMAPSGEMTSLDVCRALQITKPVEEASSSKFNIAWWMFLLVCIIHALIFVFYKSSIGAQLRKPKQKNEIL